MKNSKCCGAKERRLKWLKPKGDVDVSRGENTILQCSSFHIETPWFTFLRQRKRDVFWHEYVPCIKYCGYSTKWEWTWMEPTIWWNKKHAFIFVYISYIVIESEKSTCNIKRRSAIYCILSKVLNFYHQFQQQMNRRRI